MSLRDNGITTLETKVEQKDYLHFREAYYREERQRRLDAAALAALTSLAAAHSGSTHILALQCYDIAEAMLEEREARITARKVKPE